MNNESIVNNASKSSGHTQRNWDFSKPVLPEHIDILKDVAIQACSKQGIAPYSLCVSSDLKFNELLYTCSTSRGDSIYGQTDLVRNSQLNAPLILAFLTYSEHQLMDMDKEERIALGFKDRFGEMDCNQTDIDFSVGIAAGSVAFAAATLGYKTGFCSCVNIDMFREKLAHTDYSKEVKDMWQSKIADDFLVVCIGNPKEELKRGQVVNKEDKVVAIIPPVVQKDIPTIVLK